MSLNSGKMLEIKITTDSKDKILEEIKKYLNTHSSPTARSSSRTRKPFVIVTPNPEQIVYAAAHKEFAGILNQADVALPDGIGVVVASRILGISGRNGKRATIAARIPGVEFMEDLAGLAEEQRVRIGLIGGYEGLAIKAFECLKEKYPRLEGWATDAPEISLTSEGVEIPGAWYSDLVRKIRESETGIVFVGLGAPKQEYLIARLENDIETGIFMAVGGSFDVLSGKLKRAPLLFRLIGFEWFWRLCTEPWRWKRQQALPVFLWRVFLAKLSLRPSEK